MSGAWPSVAIRWRSVSSRILQAHDWAKAMKKRWSPVKPLTTGAGLPLSDALYAS